MNIFKRADILLPQNADMEKWAVIACDQYTSEPEWWERAEELVGGAPSTLRFISPECWLKTPKEANGAELGRNIRQALESGVFRTEENCYIYVERTLVNGAVRRGLIGAVDLEAYDYAADACSPIRATERTVTERIPPRMAVRREAEVEFPHILLLLNDPEKRIIEALTELREELPLLYDFDLMQGCGHISGRLVAGKTAELVDERIRAYETEGRGESPLLYAVGDGNHSLACARDCWRELKEGLSEAERQTHPARFALLELNNLADEAQSIEPIHRVVKHTDTAKLLQDVQSICAEGGIPVETVTAEGKGVLYLNPALGKLAVSILQSFLDEWLKNNAGEVDYIHDDASLCSLASVPGAVGFLLPPVGRDLMFAGIESDGVLPRKTFSMGHACEKRCYLEGKRIR